MQNANRDRSGLMFENVFEMVEQAEGVKTVAVCNGRVIEHPKLFKQFFEFKDWIKKELNIEFQNLKAYYESDLGPQQELKFESDYLKALEWIDGIRLMIEIQYEEKDVIKPQVPQEPAPVGEKWKCNRCNGRNEANLTKCKLCKATRK